MGEKGPKRRFWHNKIPREARKQHKHAEKREGEEIPARSEQPITTSLNGTAFAKIDSTR